MSVKLFVTKSCSNRYEFRRCWELVSILGSLKKADGGECGNTFVAFLTVLRDEAPTAIKLLTETGFKAQYA